MQRNLLKYLLAGFFLCTSPLAAGPHSLMKNQIINNNQGSEVTIEILNVVNNILIDDCMRAAIDFSMALSPDGTRGYVADTDGNLLEIDLIINTIVRKLDIHGALAGGGLLISPDGTSLYVISAEKNRVFVYDRDSLIRLKTIRVGATPSGGAITPDGSKIYIANSGDDTISVIDSYFNIETAIIPVGKHPSAIAIINGQAYVANDNDRTFSVIDTYTDAVIGLTPTMAAIQAGKNIGLANKEALVSGGALVMALAKKHQVKILPIDSEHSALFQCLEGENEYTVKRLILTASGGPFRTYTNAQLAQITPEQALRHPTWTMGAKVTIDSSTLMNKGLEVIEAHWLFNIPVERISVVIHPQSIIHSMVEFVDNSLIAQMGEPSMITPIQYALTYPERLPGSLASFDITQHANLQFFPPDNEKFRCLSLAYEALKSGGSMPSFMNAANEELVQGFLDKQIAWTDIAFFLENLMQNHEIKPIHSIDDVLEADALARRQAAELLKNRHILS